MNRNDDETFCEIKIGSTLFKCSLKVCICTLEREIVKCNICVIISHYTFFNYGFRTIQIIFKCLFCSVTLDDFFVV